MILLNIHAFINYALFRAFKLHPNHFKIYILEKCMKYVFLGTKKITKSF